MKPLFALISDVFPIMGYKKRFYMVICSILGGVAALLCATSSKAALGGDQAQVAFYYFFLINVAIAMTDSLSQGKYTEICKAKGASVVSFVSGSKVMAGMVAAMIGPVVNDISPQITFGLIAPFFVQALVVQAMNFMGDRDIGVAHQAEEPRPRCSPDMTVVQKDWKIVITGLVLGMWALMVPFTDIVHPSPWLQLGFAWVGVFIALGLTFFSLPVQVAKINVYIIFCRIATLDFRYALLQWYTAPADTCPGNPNFTYTIYQALGLWVGQGATLIGVVLFQKYVSHWHAQRAFWVTTMFTVVAACFDLSMLTKFNRTLMAPLGFGNIKPFGFRLDDLLGFLVGTQALKPIATTLDDMPATVLLSKLCPAGVETTVFAILAALQNLGLQISGLMASRLLAFYEFDIDSGKKVCNLGEGSFGLDALSWGMVCGGVILPLTTIPATWLLLPDKMLDDDFLGDDAPPSREVELQDPLAGPEGQSRRNPSYVFTDITASKKELENASFVSFTRGAANGSRLL